VSLEETSRGTHYRKTGKDPHQYRIGTWNVRTLNQGGKLENLKKEMEKNEMSIMGVSEVKWKGQCEIRSGNYTMHYSGGEKSKTGVAIVVYKSTVGSVVKKIVCNDNLLLLS
jgi:nitrogen regulatory protein PII